MAREVHKRGKIESSKLEWVEGEGKRTLGGGKQEGDGLGLADAERNCLAGSPGQPFETGLRERKIKEPSRGIKTS